MDVSVAVRQLGALAQNSRLEVFRSLIVAGPVGIAAGDLAARLAIAPSALSFHTKELRHAGLIRSETRGRFVVFFAEFDAMRNLMSFLLENCCAGIDASGAALVMSQAAKTAFEQSCQSDATLCCAPARIKAKSATDTPHTTRSKSLTT